MKAKRVQCPCGQILTLPGTPGAVKVRCPTCRAVLRVAPTPGSPSPGAPKIPRDQLRAHYAEPAQPIPEATQEEQNGDYRIVEDRSADPHAKAALPDFSAQGTFVPTGAAAAPRPTRTVTSGAVALGRSDTHGSFEASELPGPFLDTCALFYPWLHPTWIKWLGVSFIVALTICLLAITSFVFSIVARFGLMGSVFTMAAMVTACLAFVAYVASIFVAIVEGTANGDNRLERLPGLAWFETLPPFLRTFGAGGVAFAIACGLTYPIRRWLAPDDTQFALVQTALVFLFFPVLLITNLVDQSWLPFYSLFSTVLRLARCGGSFLLFLVLSAVLTLLIGAALTALFSIHVAAGLAVAGPLVAMWLFYYAHWLGRLARQLTALE